MIVKTYEISGPCAFVPSRIADTRGWFAETFRHDLFARHCGDAAFVHDDHPVGDPEDFLQIR
jgi:dTDP-4-dehydrorhamnose 3,5-epimerase